MAWKHKTGLIPLSLSLPPPLSLRLRLPLSYVLNPPPRRHSFEDMSNIFEGMFAVQNGPIFAIPLWCQAVGYKALFLTNSNQIEAGDEKDGTDKKRTSSR